MQSSEKAIGVKTTETPTAVRTAQPTEPSSQRLVQGLGVKKNNKISSTTTTTSSNLKSEKANESKLKSESHSTDLTKKKINGK